MLPEHFWTLAAAAAALCGCVLGVKRCHPMVALVGDKFDSVEEAAAVDGRHTLQHLRNTPGRTDDTN
jgi:hypothetical protein